VAGSDRDDYFHRLTLDEEFVRGASKKEPAASDRVRLSYRQSVAQREQAQLADRLRAANRPNRRLRRWMGRQKSKVIFLVVVAMIGVAAYFDTRQPSNQILWGTAEPQAEIVDVSRAPSAKLATSKTPLGSAPDVANTNAPYAFVMTQEGSAQPVAFDPCRPIPVVINDAGAPAGTTPIIEEAIERISAVTGLQFVLEGGTDEPADVAQRQFQPERYGDRWAPVLISWSDDSVVEELAGDVIGLGGSVSFARTAKDPQVFVTGQIVFDTPQVTEMLDEKRGRAGLRAVALHELAHVVGLDHVDDESQLMNPSSSDVFDFQAGDLAGLAQLGRGACVARL
jgi:hypothetical protein